MNAIVASVIVFLVQLGTGWVKAVAARKAAQSANDLLAEVKAWHAWYPLMVSEWNKLRKK